MMLIKTRLTALTSVIAVLAVSPPVASARAPTTPAKHSVPALLLCPDPNPAWGCGPYSVA
jgi:hypothetical protein